MFTDKGILRLEPRKSVCPGFCAAFRVGGQTSSIGCEREWHKNEESRVEGWSRRGRWSWSSRGQFARLITNCRAYSLFTLILLHWCDAYSSPLSSKPNRPTTCHVVPAPGCREAAADPISEPPQHNELTDLGDPPNSLLSVLQGRRLHPCYPLPPPLELRRRQRQQAVPQHRRRDACRQT